MIQRTIPGLIGDKPPHQKFMTFCMAEAKKRGLYAAVLCYNPLDGKIHCNGNPKILKEVFPNKEPEIRQ